MDLSLVVWNLDRGPEFELSGELRTAMEPLSSKDNIMEPYKAPALVKLGSLQDIKEAKMDSKRKQALVRAAEELDELARTIKAPAQMRRSASAR